VPCACPLIGNRIIRRSSRPTAIVKSTNDNHSSYSGAGISRIAGGGMPAPLSAQFLDNRLIVTRLAPSTRDTTSIRRGDEIERVDGLTVDSRLRSVPHSLPRVRRKGCAPTSSNIC